MHWTIKYPSQYCYYSCVNKFCDECLFFPNPADKPKRIEVPDPWDKEFYEKPSSFDSKQTPEKK